MEIDYYGIGNRIRNVRIERKLTQEVLADLAGLTPAHISHIECGKTKVSLPSLISIACAMGTTVDALLYDASIAPYTNCDREFTALTSDCTAKERRVILEAVSLLKNAMRLDA